MYYLIETNFKTQQSQAISEHSSIEEAIGSIANCTTLPSLFRIMTIVNGGNVVVATIMGTTDHFHYVVTYPNGKTQII